MLLMHLWLVVCKVERKKCEVSISATGEERVAAEECLRTISAQFQSSKVDREFQERQLDMSRKLLEGQCKRALQGEILLRRIPGQNCKIRGRCTGGSRRTWQIG
jgi:hypothetical protein